MGGFDHAILAIQLPAEVQDASLMAVMQHPKLGRLLFFDPTSELTAFGRLSGAAASKLRIAGDTRGRRTRGIASAPRCAKRNTENGEVDVDANGDIDWGR